MAGAVFGEVALSLFVAGAVFGGFWNDSPSAKCNLGCEAGCGLTVSCSDHSRIMVGSFSYRPCIVNDVSSVFSKFL